MKKILLVCILLISVTAVFAQKSKSVPPKPDTAAQAKYTCSMHPDVVSDKPGNCPKCNMPLTLSSKEQMKQDVTHTYTCPMHPNIVSDHAGICAKCKSKLVADRTSSKKAKSVYSCSMHPEVAGNKGGKCPVCGEPLSMEKQKPE